MTRPRRILVIGPAPRLGSSNHLPWLRYTASALQRLGHEVRTAAYRESWAKSPALSARLSAVGGRAALRRWASAMDRRRDEQAVATARAFRPDVTIVLKGEVYGGQVLGDIKQATAGAMVSWWVDDPWVYPDAVAQLPRFDTVFCFDRSYLVPIAAAGAPSAVFLPCAADDLVFAPQALSAPVRQRLETDVAFVATYYPGRAALARSVAERSQVGVWGIGWRSPDAVGELGGLDLVRGGIVDDREAGRIYAATKVGLNVHHRHSRLGGVNTRTFELLANGTAALVDRLPGLEELLEPGREVACYGCADEARDVAASLVADDRGRAAIAERGRARVRAEHTFVSRMRKILDTVDAL